MENLVLPKGAPQSVSNLICPKNHGVLGLGSNAQLAKGRIHEVQGDCADAFAMIAASSLEGAVFWIGMERDVRSLAPSGIQRFFDPARLIAISGVSRLEVLWAAEQALRSEGAACVIIEAQSGPDLRESRRLQIACEENGALGLVLIKGRAQTSAAETRWICDAAQQDVAAWTWRCTKHRRGETGAWRVNLRGNRHGPCSIHMASATAA